MTNLTDSEHASVPTRRSDPTSNGAHTLAPGPRVVSLQGVWERLGTPLLRSVLLALLAGLLLAGLAGAVVVTRPATYRSQATLLLDEPGAVALAPDEGVLLKLSALRAKYAALADTTPILQGAARLSDLSLATVSADSQVSYGATALTMQAQGISSDPATARLVAQSLGQALALYVASEQTGLQVPSADRLTMTVIQPAGAPVKISPTNRRVAAVTILAFIVGWILVYLVVQLEATRRWRPRLG